MIIEELPPNASLAEILGARALRTPIDRLAIDMVGGALVSAAAIWARPSGWVALLAAALCFLCYGAWAIAERRLHSAAWPAQVAREPLWRALHATAALAGIAAFGLLLLAGLGLALGPIIS